MGRKAIFWISIVILALFLYGIALRERGSLRGDEYHTVFRVTTPKATWNSLLYFLLLNKWVRFSERDLWLRFFSALFGILNIFMIYFLGKEFLDKNRALILMLIALFSPYMMYYSTLVRYYSFFLFFCLCSYLFFWLWINRRKRIYLLTLFAFNILLTFTHIFGILVIFLEVVYTWIVCKQKKMFFRFIIFLAASIAVIIIINLFPTVKQSGFKLIQSWTNPLSKGVFTYSKGLTIANMAKIPLLFYFFIFGFSIYPFNIFVAGFTAFIIGLCINAVRYVIKKRKECIFFLLFLVYVPLLFYLGFDSLMFPGGGIAPRHLIFLAPIFYLFLTIGLPRASSKMLSFLSALFLIPLCVYTYFTIRPQWSYQDNSLMDWSEAYYLILRNNYEPEIIVCDSRSKGPLQRYFKLNIPIVTLEEFITRKQLASYSSVLLVSKDWRRERINKFNSLVRKLQSYYDYKVVYGKFPAFIYFLKRGFSPFNEKRKNVLPLSISTIEFQDLQFPFSLYRGGREYLVNNIYKLTKNTASLQTSFAPIEIKSFTVISNTTGIKPPLLSKIAEVRLFFQGRLVDSFPLLYGKDTFDWLSQGQLDAIYTWHKKIAFVGSAYYTGAWRDATARIYARTFSFSSPIALDSVSIILKDKSCALNLFGIFLE